MMVAPRLLALLLLPLAGGCVARKIPRPDAPWVALGGTKGSLTTMDTSRIGARGSARLVWLRTDSVAPNADGDPVVVPAARRETLHRVQCATSVVSDLPRPTPGAAAAEAGATPEVPFAQHPYGAHVFPTVCTLLGNIGARRASR